MNEAWNHPTQSWSLRNNRHMKQSTVSECPESYAEWYCLNGATCFVVKIRDAALYNCWCQPGFHGARCDFKYRGHRENEAAINESLVKGDVGRDLDPTGSQDKSISDELILVGKFVDAKVHLADNCKQMAR